MNKNFKNKIAALFAVLSVCSPQSSRAADNKKLVKVLAIGVPSVLLTGGVVWGVVPFRAVELSTTDEIMNNGIKIAVESGIVKKGDTVIITGSSAIGKGGTDMMQIYQI